MKITILETAGKLLKADINSMKAPKDFYPSFNEVSSTEFNVSFLPESLQLLMKAVLGQTNDTKVTSIGQIIIQTIGSRSVNAPL